MSDSDLADREQFNLNHRSSVLTPERKLMFAMLADAIDLAQRKVLRRYASSSQASVRDVVDARSWLLGADGRKPISELFTAASICGELGINTAVLRDKVARHVKIDMSGILKTPRGTSGNQRVGRR